jgi:hypothetical protein
MLTSWYSALVLVDLDLVNCVVLVLVLIRVDLVNRVGCSWSYSRVRRGSEARLTASIDVMYANTLKQSLYRAKFVFVSLIREYAVRSMLAVSCDVECVTLTNERENSDHQHISPSLTALPPFVV